MSRFYDASKGDSNLDRMHQVDQVCGGDSANPAPRAADMTPGSMLPAPTEPIEPGRIPRRVGLLVVAGVFAVEYAGEILFTKRIDIRPDQLEEWEPEPGQRPRT